MVKPRSSEAYEGDNVIIFCEVVGDPKPDVVWLRDFLNVSMRVTSGERQLGSKRRRSSLSRVGGAASCIRGANKCGSYYRAIAARSRFQSRCFIRGSSSGEPSDVGPMLWHQEV